MEISKQLVKQIYNAFKTSSNIIEIIDLAEKNLPSLLRWELEEAIAEHKSRILIKLESNEEFLIHNSKIDTLAEMLKIESFIELIINPDLQEADKELKAKEV